jgi:hypothetical protein
MAAHEGTPRRTSYQLELRLEATREVYIKRRTSFANEEYIDPISKGINM